MVGAEIMNRGFKPKFDKIKKTCFACTGLYVFTGKISVRHEINGTDITCVGCSDDCRVNELVEAWEKRINFDVYIVPHSSSFTKWLERWQNNNNTGLIAVACLLNLVPGGYEMRELGLNAQCVLLDYCGCKNHWHEEGICTDLNESKVLELR